MTDFNSNFMQSLDRILMGLNPTDSAKVAYFTIIDMENALNLWKERKLARMVFNNKDTANMDIQWRKGEDLPQ